MNSIGKQTPMIATRILNVLPSVSAQAFSTGTVTSKTGAITAKLMRITKAPKIMATSRSAMSAPDVGMVTVVPGDRKAPSTTFSKTRRISMLPMIIASSARHRTKKPKVRTASALMPP